MPVRLLSALALLALCLALPAAAAAQGAGDDQYADPFAGEDTQQEAAPTATPAPAQPQAAPSQAAPAPAATPEPAEPVAASAPTAREQLPYTGADAGLLALAGALLIGAGAALRLRVRADHQR